MSTPRDRAAVAASGLFRNLGTALLLMRGLRRWVFEDLLAARGR